MITKISKITSVSLLLLLTLLVLGQQFRPAAASDHRLLTFDRMTGNTPAFTGATNPIRGINGGGLPWMVGSASGELRAGGRLEINVQGLVLAAGANAGSNPVAEFRAIVSCLAGDGSVQNVMTDPFPATTGPARQGGGNASIRTHVALPQPCIAPIVFVTSPGGAWFAATGG
jgi:hypothetical protein